MYMLKLTTAFLTIILSIFHQAACRKYLCEENLLFLLAVRDLQKQEDEGTITDHMTFEIDWEGGKEGKKRGREGGLNRHYRDDLCDL